MKRISLAFFCIPVFVGAILLLPGVLNAGVHETVTQSVTVTSATSTATIHWAVPEMRVGAPGTNDDTMFFLTVRNSGSVLFTTPVIASSTPAGTYDTPILLDVPNGTYDIGFKGHQHLTKILRTVPLNGSNRVLNFSRLDYTNLLKGTEVLEAGDINGTTTSAALMGDDKVNALDLTTLLSQFNATDKFARPNLNQDAKVNALDLTIILKNFNHLGQT